MMCKEELWEERKKRADIVFQACGFEKEKNKEDWVTEGDTWNRLVYLALRGESYSPCYSFTVWFRPESSQVDRINCARFS